MTGSHDYETVYCSNGWLEIRNPGDDAQWIATDEPFEIER